MSGSTFGLTTPFINPAQQGPWGLSPYGTQGLGNNPFASQGHPFASQGQPFQSPFQGSPIGSGYGVQPQQQLLQLLQVLPQQLQQLEQQFQQVQQLVQLIPAQIGQLQQLILLVARQGQQPSPFQQTSGQVPGLGSYGSTSPWGNSPQIFGGQPGHIM